jgi:hypothetical protein
MPSLAVERVVLVRQQQLKLEVVQSWTTSLDLATRE